MYCKYIDEPKDKTKNKKKKKYVNCNHILQDQEKKLTRTKHDMPMKRRYTFHKIIDY